jgi:hypothetical protein
MMRLLGVEHRDWVTLHRYWHPTRGTVRTAILAAEPNVIHIGGSEFDAGERRRQPKQVSHSQHRRQGVAPRSGNFCALRAHARARDVT